MSKYQSIFNPLEFRNLHVKNRLFRSSIGTRVDHFDGTGSYVRINFDEQFAKGGAGAIISGHSEVEVRGRMVPNAAMINSDDTIPFWKELGNRIHKYDCKYILQLCHGGADIPIKGIDNEYYTSLSSSGGIDNQNGYYSIPMTSEQINDVVDKFAQGARRAREAGLDGVELHACNGTLINQFLSSAINKRTDAYGGSVENRARFLIEIIHAIRNKVGNDFHLQVKINAVDLNNAIFPWEKPGNNLTESIQICKLIENAAADAVHISVGSFFPHPSNPAGEFPIEDVKKCYGVALASGKHNLRNYLIFNSSIKKRIFAWLWNKGIPVPIEGKNLVYSKEIKKHIGIPVIVTGGFQTASIINDAIQNQLCDAVSMARTLIANPDLPNIFARNQDTAPKPCTYCNKCLYNSLINPVGCYDITRFDGNQIEMVDRIMEQFKKNN